MLFSDFVFDHSLDQGFFVQLGDVLDKVKQVSDPARNCNMHAVDAKDLRLPRIVRQQNKLRQLIIAMLFCHERLVRHTNQRFRDSILHHIKCADLESQFWMNLQNLVKFAEHGLPGMQSVVQV